LVAFEQLTVRLLQFCHRVLNLADINFELFLQHRNLALQFAAQRIADCVRVTLAFLLVENKIAIDNGVFLNLLLLFPTQMRPVVPVVIAG